MILIYALGYAWSALTTIPGLVLALLCAALRWIVDIDCRGPAMLVYLRGPWAARMQRPNAEGFTFYGHTVGPFVFLYDPAATDKQITHECRHVTQQMVLGPINLLVYGLSWLIGLVKTRSTFWAYRQVWQERDARRFAGQGENE